MSFELFLFVGLLFGVGIGYFVQRSGLCFAHGFGEIFMGKGKRIFSLFLVIFIITALGFLLSGYVFPDRGLKPIGQIRGYGLINILSGVLFGAGILINGGCILGTLRQIGEGNLLFIIILLSFIPGMALVVYVIDPMLQANYHVQKTLLPDVFNLSAPWITGILTVGAVIGYIYLRKAKRKKSK